ncbi:MAG: tetratricopeptide repeat protein [Bacteroidota bacterium]
MRYLIPSILLLLLALACTPKATPVIDEEPPPPPSTEVEEEPVNSRCATFDDDENPDYVADQYFLYRQAIKRKEYDEAFKKWKIVYERSPAADGERNTVLTDGIFFYNLLIQADSTSKERYAKKIVDLYAQADECYPDNAYMIGLRGFDSYYTYPGMASDEEVYAMFKRSIDLDEEDFPFFVINPMSKLVYDRYEEGDIDLEEARYVVQHLTDRLAKGLSECEENGDCDTWGLINGYMPSAIAQFETVDDFFDCDYYVELYYPNFEANPDDCATVVDVLNRLKWGGCKRETSPEYASAIAVYESECRIDTTKGTNPLREGYDAIRNNDNERAIELLTEGVELIADPEKKAQVYMAIANTEYRMRRFSSARATARKAAQLRPGWGQPYMLIGRMYASSGPLCGSGTGFDSQRVVWVAIDMWNRAKQVDGSVAGEANKLIGQYRQYLPFRADVFQRGLKEGDSYTVPCWIQQSTTIRTIQ